MLRTLRLQQRTTDMLKRTLLILAVLCGIAAPVLAQSNASLMGHQQLMQSQINQMQIQQIINNSREDPCQPGFHGLFGINLSKQLGMCGRQEEAQSLAPRTEPTRQAPPREGYTVAAQPRAVPPMRNGPMSVYDRPYPYYRGH